MIKCKYCKTELSDVEASDPSSTDDAVAAESAAAENGICEDCALLLHIKPNKNSTAEKAQQTDIADVLKNRALSALCYLPLLFLLPSFFAKKSKYAAFHASQGFRLSFFGMAGSATIFIGYLIKKILTYFGIHADVFEIRLIFSICSSAFFIFWCILSVIGASRAATNTGGELPIVGKIFSKRQKSRILFESPENVSATSEKAESKNAVVENLYEKNENM